MAKTENNKRLILILGGKGGTGKTLFCRVLYYYLLKDKINCKGYDADIENTEFYEIHTKSSNPVEPLNFLAIEDAKTLFTLLHDKKPDVALVDMPGASGAGTRDQLDLFGVFGIIKELGYRLTIATVMNNTFNPINSLDAMLRFCGTQSDYLVVKSQLYSQGALNFNRWEVSKTRKLLQEMKGLEIDLPVLEPSVFDVIHELNLSFFDMDKLPFGDRILADSFLARTLPELQRAGEYLGFPVAAAKTTSAKASDAKGAEAKTTDPGKALPELVGTAPSS